MKPVEFKTTIEELQHLAGHYFELSPSIIKKLGGKMSIRLIATVNKKISWQCGPMALGKGSAYITISAKRMKELGVKPGDTIHISIVKDESKYGVDVPEELGELLKQDPEGEERFEALTPGMQRYIINYVATVKSPRLKLERALMLITNLKKLKKGKESFREILGLPKK
jgi:Bacteriocin-protection, YdeI or OmpD-Associated/Domain of unknown function (DUF1905)